MKKQCNKCGCIKSINEFYKHKKGLYGRDGTCKQCKNTRYKKTCSYCEKEYFASSNKSIYCSRECSSNAKKGELVEKECEICKKKYYILERLSEESRFCSRKCQGVSKRNSVNKECVHCKKIFRLPKSSLKAYGGKYNIGSFCSAKCKYKHYRENGWPKSKEKVEVKCEVCGKKELVHPYKGEHQRFCSRECKHKAVGEHLSVLFSQPDKYELRKCKWCESEFKVLKSKKGRGKFCSRECHGAYTVRYNQNRVSKIEQEFVNALREKGLEFEHQAKVGKFVVDVFFPKQKIIVEFDGDYWHSLPHVIEKDKRKDKFFENEGFRVIHIPENLFKEKPEVALNIISLAVC